MEKILIIMLLFSTNIGCIQNSQKEERITSDLTNATMIQNQNKQTIKAQNIEVKYKNNDFSFQLSFPQKRKIAFEEFNFEENDNKQFNLKICLDHEVKYCSEGIGVGSMLSVYKANHKIHYGWGIDKHAETKTRSIGKNTFTEISTRYLEKSKIEEINIPIFSAYNLSNNDLIYSFTFHSYYSEKDIKDVLESFEIISNNP